MTIHAGIYAISCTASMSTNGSSPLQMPDSKCLICPFLVTFDVTRPDLIHSIFELNLTIPGLSACTAASVSQYLPDYTSRP
jgi:hypothetical protein